MTEGQKHLLIVDDESALREAIAERLADHGFVVEQAGSGEHALERLAEFAFDILITDLRLPGIDGRQVLEAALERYPEIIAIVITGYGTVKDAVEAIKQGAADFITKPFQFDALLHVVRSALEQRRLKSENAYLRSQLEERYRIDGLVGHSRVDARPVSAARNRRRHVEHGADHRRDRNGQGARRARHPSQQPAACEPVRRASTAAPFRKRCSRPSCSATSAARSRARSARDRAGSSRPTKARCSSTRSGR